jgi:methyltransferase
MSISLTAYTVGLALLATERAVELLVSRRNTEWAMARGGIEVGHAQYRVIVVFHTLFFFACFGEAVLLNRSFLGSFGFAALAAAVAAQVLRYWVVATLGERWNTRIIVLPGLAPVTSGPYRYVRHPNYLAVLVEMTCVPLIYGCWITALVYAVGNYVLLTIRIRDEERALGQGYADIFALRPRLLPRRRPVPRCR